MNAKPTVFNKIYFIAGGHMKWLAMPFEMHFHVTHFLRLWYNVTNPVIK